MDEMRDWHTWAIKRNRYDNVIRHIRDNVPEVDKFFYPFIRKEYKTKRGVRVKDSPLYEGYLYVRYYNHAQVFHKMSQCPFVTTYVGIITEEELQAMEEAEGKLLTEIRTSKFRPGDTVIILEGPFKDFEARVVVVESGLIRVRVSAQLLGSGVEMYFKEDSVEHKSELKNTKVQDV